MKMIIVKPKNTKLWAPHRDKYIGKTVTIERKALFTDTYEVKENILLWRKEWLKTPLEYFLEELDNENDNI